jgi:hypothetical protein
MPGPERIRHQRNLIGIHEVETKFHNIYYEGDGIYSGSFSMRDDKGKKVKPIVSLCVVLHSMGDVHKLSGASCPINSIDKSKKYSIFSTYSRAWFSFDSEDELIQFIMDDDSGDDSMLCIDDMVYWFEVFLKIRSSDDESSFLVLNHFDSRSNIDLSSLDQTERIEQLHEQNIIGYEYS